MAVAARVWLATAVLCGLAEGKGWEDTYGLELQAGRVVGGRNASIREFPYQVSLQHKFSMGGGGSHFCGGSIIDERHILTAAHCLYGNSVNRMIVSGGMTNVQDFKDPKLQSQPVEAKFIHDSFDHLKLISDIAIIRVAGSFSLDGQYMAAAALQNSTPPAGTMCTITGWGYDETYQPSATLQAVDLPLIPADECAKMYDGYGDPNSEVRADNVCAGLKEGGKDSCNGDSGGPMTCGGMVTGIVSWGDTVCGIPSYPGVYTSVFYYRDWIANTLAASYAQLSLKRLQP